MRDPVLLVPSRLRAALARLDDFRRFVVRKLAYIRTLPPSAASATLDDDMTAIVRWLDAERGSAWSAWIQGEVSAEDASRKVDRLLAGLECDAGRWNGSTQS